jgi:fumarate hydratase, class II
VRSFRRASAIAHKADADGTTLRDAALAEGVDAKEFDEFVDVGKMVGDPRPDVAAVAAS